MSWIDVSSAGLSPVANGRDAFLLTAGLNLPVYRKRLDSSVRSAEAKAVSSAREYDSLRDGTLEEVTDLFAQAKSQQDMLQLFREDILPKARPDAGGFQPRIQRRRGRLFAVDRQLAAVAPL